MKKTSLKAAIAVLSLTMALTPMGFAQSPAAQTSQPSQVVTQAALDTAPLPGAQVQGAALGLPLLLALVAAGVITLVVINEQQQKDNDEETARILAILAAAATGTR